MRIQSAGNTGAASGGISLSRGTDAPAPLAQAAPVATGGVSLRKGEKVSLTKNNPGLNEITVGLGWDANGFVGQDFDLDAQVFMLKADGKVLSDKHFIFYNQAVSPEGSVTHSGDNKTGAGDGDDEVIQVKLQSIPAEVQKVLFTVTIHDARTRQQSFGQVSNSYIHVLDKNTGQELMRYDLTEDYSVETALVVGEIYRHNTEWKFNAVGAGFNDELVDFCNRYGVNLA